MILAVARCWPLFACVTCLALREWATAGLFAGFYVVAGLHALAGRQLAAIAVRDAEIQRLREHERDLERQLRETRKGELNAHLRELGQKEVP